MNNYIVTFYSHFGAMVYYKYLRDRRIVAKLMAVPRKVSSSCGTCVSYKYDTAIDIEDCELDSVYLDEEGMLTCIVKK
jgi:hypothetical protein